ncbi:TrmB family transcriptional regulator, partial [Halolamina salina]|uniref:TrmB family transcriptional regulator n=1 Tax=Halolamina salina TaxID=1220023 RepID=UPI003623F8BF
MHDDDLRAALERVGETFDFGEYEIEAYLAVLEHGRLTATEIAERTDIPQPRVYDTVRSLADHGFVELQESRPMQVLAIEPEEAFGGVRSSLDELVSGLEQRYTAPARDAEAVTLIKSPATIERYLGEVIESAEFELLLSLTPDLLAEFEDELREKREAGVTIELLVSPAAEVPDPEEYDYTDVATTARSRRGVTTPVAAVGDGQFSLYATREAVSRGEERYGVVFNRSELGFLVSGFVSTVLWASGETLATTPDRSLPRRYASLRRCVEEVEALDGPLRATVEGRDVLG